jgi:hypothetical protein
MPSPTPTDPPRRHGLAGLGHAATTMGWRIAFLAEEGTITLNDCTFHMRMRTLAPVSTYGLEAAVAHTMLAYPLVRDHRQIDLHVWVSPRPVGPLLGAVPDLLAQWDSLSPLDLVVIGPDVIHLHVPTIGMPARRIHTIPAPAFTAPQRVATTTDSGLTDLDRWILRALILWDHPQWWRHAQPSSTRPETCVILRRDLRPQVERLAESAACSHSTISRRVQHLRSLQWIRDNASALPGARRDLHLSGTPTMLDAVGSSAAAEFQARGTWRPAAGWQGRSPRAWMVAAVAARAGEATAPMLPAISGWDALADHGLLVTSAPPARPLHLAVLQPAAWAQSLGLVHHQPGEAPDGVVVHAVDQRDLQVATLAADGLCRLDPLLAAWHVAADRPHGREQVEQVHRQVCDAWSRTAA